MEKSASNNSAVPTMSVMEAECHHMYYSNFLGGKYEKGTFDDENRSFTLLCSKCRINAIGQPWLELPQLVQIPSNFKERCPGKLLIRVQDCRDIITSVVAHSCDVEDQVSMGEILVRQHVDRKIDEETAENMSVNSFCVKKLEVLADDRCPITLFGPCPQQPWMKSEDVNRLVELLKLAPKRFFQNTAGGRDGSKNVRQYAKNLSEYKEIHDLVEKCMSRYILWVQEKYPALKHYKLSVLKSSPEAKSQYELCNDRLHSDYPHSVNLRPPHERPMSLLVALDGFLFLYMRDRNNKRSMIVEQLVYPGQALAFTNYLPHAGGRNTSVKSTYRLFAYMVSDKADIPHNTVNHFNWKRGNNAFEDTLCEVNETVLEKDLDVQGNEVMMTRNRQNKAGRYTTRVDKYTK